MQVSTGWALALVFLLVDKSVSDTAPAPTKDNIEKESSSPVCEEIVGDDVVNDLIAWIKEEGGIVDDRQEVRRSNNVTSPNSVYATSFIPEGTVLLSIPWHLVVEPKGTLDESPLCDTVKILSQELEANEKGKSKYGPYIRYLERLTDPFTLPSAWSRGGKELLKMVSGENLKTGVNAMDKPFRDWHKECVKGVFENNPLEKAAELVVGYHTPNPPGVDFGWYHMMPFYDFYSPREDGQHNVWYGQDYDKEEMFLIAKRNIQAGEKIHTPMGFGKTSYRDPQQFFQSGKLERRHFFSFTDPRASKKNKDMSVEFDLDRDIDANGKTTLNITWVGGLRPHCRAYEQMELELNRTREIVAILPLNALYHLQPAQKHERKAIEEYTWSLIEALEALLDTRHDPRPVTPWTLHDYEVGGINLATYNLNGVEEVKVPKAGAKPFELFEDFDISGRITGNENWIDMIELRRTLERPTMSFYVDKVARKRWLPKQGFSQAKPFVLQYGSELTETENRDDEADALYKLIPDEVDYAAKPSHHSEGVSVWLVNHDKEKNITSFSSTARQLKQDEKNAFDKMNVAKSLTRHLHVAASPDESWILRNVRPGIVMEERFVDVDNFDRAPVELNCFVIWGRLWVAQVNEIEEEGRFATTWIHRDGSFIEGKEERPNALDYVDFPRVVKMAETLGRNKDMFRVDIFVGLPASSPSVQANSTREERMAQVQYAINECEIYPTTSFKWWPQLAQDGARLWVAGYKIGNYRTIPNDEVPKEFFEKGYLPE